MADRERILKIRDLNISFKVEGKKVYLLTKDEVNTLVEETQTLYLYNRAK